MNQKRKKILETALKLMSTKGYHSTSMQEIAEDAGVSKGALYLHFSSKNELLVEIYRYYYQMIKEKMNLVDDQRRLDSKERLQAQIQIYMEELLSQKEFILMHMNEHVSYSEELEEFLQTAKADAFAWYRESLTSIYGESILPYTIDLTIILKGMIEGYLFTLFSTNASLSTDKLTGFIISRLDDVVEGLLRKKEKPLFDLALINHQAQSLFGESHWREQLCRDFLQLEKIIVEANIDENIQRDCLDSIEFLKEEAKQVAPKKIIFQGLLNNLQAIPETQELSSNILQTITKQLAQ
ncbi:TetR/AcrR family transcriptional regulator [Bacillus tuaregi]|uniref:TetR/AcrR family transcriptional regulator n=1 Tax=Bacillus tuaregi TaxID=1816695 RepID=UPI0008F88A8E|nr:TetR/AcrR family transcriptional regulator [Bacillus tuaregi]